MENTTSGSRPKLYCGTACDQCFRCKARCSGDRPVCQRCQSNQSACTYSISKPLKRSKEGRNRSSRSFSTGQPPNLTPSSCTDSVDTTRMPTVLNTRSSPHCSPASQQLHTEQWNSNPHLPSSNLSSYSGTEGFLPIQGLDFSNADGCGSHEDNVDFQEFSNSQVPADLDRLMNVDGSHSVVASSLSVLHSEDVLAPSHLLPTPQEEEVENNGRRNVPSLFAETSISDPASIQVIRNLSRIRLRRTERLSFDSTLVLAKQGLKIVTSCLPDKHSPQPDPSSQKGSTTLAFACIYVADLVLACYAILQFQIKQNSQSSSGQVRIGEFYVEGDEIRQQLLLLVLIKEIERCKEDVTKLLQWVTCLIEEDDCSGIGNQLLRPFMESLLLCVESLGNN